jgi:ATP-dependent helicase/nuclease subunit B
MANLSRTLERIAGGRRDDPLAPVTVVVPSHVAGIQLRRRLGRMGPFAGVRFETLPRLAEMIAAGSLASQGLSPLARPIGDYLAGQAALDSRDELAEVKELPGYGRVLRQLFRRIRRGGIRSPEQVKVPLSNGYMGELMRLYGEFRRMTAAFYDEEDLLEAGAAVVSRAGSAVARELGAIYVVPPGALSAGADAFLRALRRMTGSVVAVAETDERPAESFVLSPDPATEARDAVREVLTRLNERLGLDEIAVFYGADQSYTKLLRDAFDSARVPMALMPGVPLLESVSGRAVLALAALPDADYSRAAVMDFLALAPLKARIPAGAESVAPLAAPWDRLSREAGITKGAARWREGLRAREADLEADISAHDPDIEEWRREAILRQLGQTRELEAVIEGLISRLEPLRRVQPADEFVTGFKAAVFAYLHGDAPHIDRVVAEIDQLGTIGAVGGSFTLGRFVSSLRANLEIAPVRERQLGEGVFVADYRLAAGLQFRHTRLCGAFEGSFPAGPGADTLVDDSEWAALRTSFPFLEDATVRVERGVAAARRAVSSAAGGSLTWSAPLYEPGGRRQYYPSPLMAQAAARDHADLGTASALRSALSRGAVRRSLSPLAASLSGPALDRFEAGLRLALHERSTGVLAGEGHRLYHPMRLLRARRGAALSEFDGNLSTLSGSGLGPSGHTSPTVLEKYAACGFQFFCGHVLRLRSVEEPEEREVMDAAERGSLMHDVLDAFFKEMRAGGRPGPGEPWRREDSRRLREIAEDRLSRARERGVTGLDIFAGHDARTVLADLAAFMEEDSVFRAETGAVPSEFEVPLPESEVAGLRLKGFVDRIDRSPDGSRAWVVDYKTGSYTPFKDLSDQDPFLSGTKLQLPAYVLAAADAEEVEALYWFISRKGEFRRVNYAPTRQNQERFEQTVAAILDGVAAGSFPAVPGDEDEFYGTWGNCRYCDFQRICSRRREEDFRLKMDSEAVRPWAQVGEIARELRP